MAKEGMAPGKFVLPDSYYYHQVKHKGKQTYHPVGNPASDYLISV